MGVMTMQGVAVGENACLVEEFWMWAVSFIV